MRTTIPGLYAAGDCTGGLLQVAKAVYEGAVAGMDASRYTRPRKHRSLQPQKQLEKGRNSGRFHGQDLPAAGIKNTEQEKISTKHK